MREIAKSVLYTILLLGGTYYYFQLIFWAIDNHHKTFTTIMWGLTILGAVMLVHSFRTKLFP